MKIDCHVHLTSPRFIEDRTRLNEPYWDLLSKTPQNRYATAEELIAEMDRCGIDQSIVFGFAFNDPALCAEANDYTIESVKAYPDRLIGYMVVNPGDRNLQKEIERCCDAGLRGIGEIFAEGQNIDITSKEETDPLMKLCLEQELPVMLHCNEKVGHYYPGKVSTNPFEASQFVQNHPENRILLAHWGGGLIFYELMKELKDSCKNVFYDTAASIFLYDSAIFRAIREMGLLPKVLFGSDYPLISPGRYFDYIDNCGLDKKDIELIYYNNAMTFLGGKRFN